MKHDFAKYGILGLCAATVFVCQAVSQEVSAPKNGIANSAANGTPLPDKPSPANIGSPSINLPEEVRNIKVNPTGKIDIQRLKVVALTEDYSQEQCKASFPDTITVGVSQSVFKLEEKNSVLITHRDNRLIEGVLHFQGQGNWKGERAGPFQFHITGFVGSKVFHGMSIDNKCITLFSVTPHPGTLSVTSEKEVPSKPEMPMSDAAAQTENTASKTQDNPKE